MVPTFKTQALVLRRVNVHEADRLVILLTPHHGKIEALVQGGAKIGSKLAGHLEPYSVSRVTIVCGHRGDKVTGAEMLKSLPNLYQSVRRRAYADLVAEITNALIKTREPDPAIYKLVGLAWTAMNRLRGQPVKSDAQAALIVTGWLLKLMAKLGFGYDLNHCVACRRVLKPSGNTLSLPHGGILPASCRITETVDRPYLLSAPTFTLLRYLQKTPLQHWRAVAITKAHLRSIEIIRDAIATQIMEREPKSVIFLKAINRQTSPKIATSK